MSQPHVFVILAELDEAQGKALMTLIHQQLQIAGVKFASCWQDADEDWPVGARLVEHSLQPIAERLKRHWREDRRYIDVNQIER